MYDHKRGNCRAEPLKLPVCQILLPHYSARHTAVEEGRYAVCDKTENCPYGSAFMNAVGIAYQLGRRQKAQSIKRVHRIKNMSLKHELQPYYSL